MNLFYHNHNTIIVIAAQKRSSKPLALCLALTWLWIRTELSTGQMDPRVGSGRVGSGRVTILQDFGGSGRVSISGF